MQENTIFITSFDFNKLMLGFAAESKLFVPSEPHYQDYQGPVKEEIAYDEIRPIEPLKCFFFAPREAAIKYSRVEPVTFIGVKNCDLRSLEVLDKIFKSEDFKDIRYIEKRQKSRLISADCSQPGESCFCTLMNSTPYPQEGFDLNLSKVEGGFVVEVGSEKGKEIIAKNKDLFIEASQSQLEERKGNRTAVLKQVEKQNESLVLNKPFDQIVKEGLGSPVWEELARGCVECGACTNICPTCHCFLLHDRKTKEEFERIRTWDSCSYPGFAKIGGDTNPRPKLSNRFRHRYIHRFVFFPENFGMSSCVGCGRCIETCLVGIDLREDLKRLEKVEV